MTWSKWSALALTLVGLAIGLPVVFYCVQLVKSQLYDMTGISPSRLMIAIPAHCFAEKWRPGSCTVDGG
jgi:hypothetical protein